MWGMVAGPEISVACRVRACVLCLCCLSSGPMVLVCLFLLQSPLNVLWYAFSSPFDSSPATHQALVSAAFHSLVATVFYLFSTVAFGSLSLGAVRAGFLLVILLLSQGKVSRDTVCCPVLVHPPPRPSFTPPCTWPPRVLSRLGWTVCVHVCMCAWRGSPVEPIYVPAPPPPPPSRSLTQSFTLPLTPSSTPPPPSPSLCTLPALPLPIQLLINVPTVSRRLVASLVPALAAWAAYALLIEGTFSLLARPTFWLALVGTLVASMSLELMVVCNGTSWSDTVHQSVKALRRCVLWWWCVNCGGEVWIVVVCELWWRVVYCGGGV
jgi:hypothetical protein